MIRWGAGVLLGTVVWAGVPAVAEGQRPGYLGKPVRPVPARAKAVPLWPRRGDPEPLKTLHYLELQLRLSRGEVKALKVVKGTFSGGPTLIKRFRGRFEARLFTGGLFVDVVRFDFPLAGGGNPGPYGDPLATALAGGVAATATIRVPFDGRISRLVIVDTRTRREFSVSLAGIRQEPLKPAVPSNIRTKAFFGRGSPGEKTDAREDRLDDAKVLRRTRPAAGQKNPQPKGAAKPGQKTDPGKQGRKKPGRKGPAASKGPTAP